jgi:predicted O-methyltransferase YrrM
MNLARALTVEGWMEPDELVCLVELAQQSKRIAEIGSWAGRSAVALAQHTPGCVFSVDTWSASLTTRTEHNADLFSKWMANTAGLPVVPVMMESARAARMFAAAGMTFDLIFLDGDHTEAYLREDIALWKPLLAEGGIFCGHDYNEPTWPDVKRVIDEVIPKFRVLGRIWIEEPAR